MYYNTTQLEGETLLKAKKSATKQDKEVLNLCLKLRVFSAYKIWSIKNNITDDTPFSVIRKTEPITSARRSLNTLEKMGKIKKMISDVTNKPIRVKGLYNSTETLYQIA